VEELNRSLRNCGAVRASAATRRTSRWRTRACGRLSKIATHEPGVTLYRALKGRDTGAYWLTRKSASGSCIVPNGEDQ
jgi:hypothetical protein